jgi:hypothetical protein
VTERHAAFFICLGERKKENLTDRAISRFIIFNIIFLFKKKEFGAKNSNWPTINIIGRVRVTLGPRYATSDVAHSFIHVSFFCYYYNIYKTDRGIYY